MTKAELLKKAESLGVLGVDGSFTKAQIEAEIEAKENELDSGGEESLGEVSGATEEELLEEGVSQEDIDEAVAESEPAEQPQKVASERSKVLREAQQTAKENAAKEQEANQVDGE